MPRTSIEEPGYIIKRQATAAITTSESNIDTKGETCYIQNVGASIVYIDVVTGVDSTKWQIAVGERSGPWTARTGSGTTADTKLYMIGAGASTLNFIFLEGM